MLDSNFRTKNADLSQWMNVLNLEAEGDLAPNGIGPFDALSVFGRVLVRYDCIYNGCGMIPTWRYYGDRASRVPANYATGRAETYNGTLPIPPSDIITGTPARGPHPRRQRAARLPRRRSIPCATGRVEPRRDLCSDPRRGLHGEGHRRVDRQRRVPLGPWHPSTEIDPTGSLSMVPSPTSALPLRPAVPDIGAGMVPHGLFDPSQSFTAKQHDLGDFEQNYSQKELAWNHGDSQDEWELKELYVDSRCSRPAVDAARQAEHRVGQDGALPHHGPVQPADSARLAAEPRGVAHPVLVGAGVFRSTTSARSRTAPRGRRQSRRLRAARPRPLRRALHHLAGMREDDGLWATAWPGIGFAGEIHPPDPWEDISGPRVRRASRVALGPLQLFSSRTSTATTTLPSIDTFNEYSRNVDVTPAGRWT